MSHKQKINSYIKTLSLHLTKLDKENANEVIREIESHIYDAIESLEAENKIVNIQDIFDGFGDPKQLASSYVSHILQGTPPPSGFKTIEKMKKGVTKTLYYSMGLFGFGISFFLLMLGVIKLISPEEVGVWSVAEGNSIIITVAEHSYPQQTEVLGYWLVPLAIVLGLAIAKLTKSVLAVLKASTDFVN